MVYAPRVRRALVATVALFVACAPSAARGPTAPVPRAAWPSRTTRLAQPGRAPHAAGREGDWALACGDWQLVVASAADAPGHRPLRGAIVDARLHEADEEDPLFWLRPGWMAADGTMHPLVAGEVVRAACDAGEGVRTVGKVDGVALETRLCATGDGRAELESRAVGLPEGAELADELAVGPAQVLTDREGGAWEGEHEAHAVAWDDGRTALALAPEGGTARVSRKLVTIAAETFPAPVRVRYAGASVRRTLVVLRGHALGALAAAGVPGIETALELPRGGHVALSTRGGREVFSAALPTGRSALSIPPSLAAFVALRDEQGIPLGERRPLGPLAPAAPQPSGRVLLDLGGPAHVLFQGEGGTPDPEPAGSTAPGARTFAAGRSLYAIDGRVETTLPAGRYAVTVTRGMTWELERFVLDLRPGAAVERTVRLADGGLPGGWHSADLHLHAAPSPDAPVSLEARVASLACEGVDVAVATDHNAITDYEPAAQALAPALDTYLGVEITSAGSALHGHFNAFPLRLPPPGTAPEDAVPAYFDVPPARMFADARARGATVVQVNHARMPPRIGYFDQTHLDPATGRADEIFSEDFDALEVLNGVWLETPARLREGALDLVALARRGKHVAATGNSDSHRLLYQEAGWPRTFFPTLVKTVPASLLLALQQGSTVASSGPLPVLSAEGSPTGATVRPRGGRVSVDLRVYAASWIPVEKVELLRDDTVVETFTVPPATSGGLRFERKFDVPVRADATLVAVVSAETPLPPVLPYADARAFAVTSPVYVDADGDGRVVVPPR
jgi:hypothetical protein